MAEYDINAKITYDTTQATAAINDVTKANKETAKAAEEAEKAQKKSHEEFQKTTEVAGLAAGTLGKISPALGGIVDTAGQAATALSALRTAGLGPVGLAISAVSIAVEAGSALWSIYAEEQRKAAKSITVDVLPALEDLISKAQRAQVALSLTSRVGQGFGTAAEQAGFVAEADAYVTQVRQKIARLQATGPEDVSGIAERIQAQTRFNEELRRLQVEQLRAEEVTRYRRGVQQQAAAEQEQIQAEEILAFQEEIAERERQLRDRGGGGGGGRRSAATPAEREDPNAAARAAGEELDRLWEQSEMRLNERRARWADEAAFQAELNAIEADDVRMRLESLESAEADAEALREQNAQEHADRMQAINDAVFGALESALSSSVDAWLSGTRSMGEAMQDMVKQVAKSLASEAIIQGLKATAMGLGALAVGSPSAALHFAEAGKWAAVGVAAGIAGAATGAFGGGGGGGGGAPAAATGGPALTAGAREGAGTTVVINWGSSGLVYAADRAQLGRDISGMISEAHGRLGRGA